MHKATAENNLKVRFPHIAAQWHPTKNNDALPEEVLPFSNKKFWWICSRGHEWDAVVASRTSGRGCPFCWKHSSKPEVRILAELETVFDAVVRRRRFEKVEADIYIPSCNVAIEYDGVRFHKNQAERDLKKNKHFEGLGIRLLRVREEGLAKLGSDDIICDSRELEKQTINELLELIRPLAALAEQQRIQAYKAANEFLAEAKFRVYLEERPLPVKEDRLSVVHPSISSEFDLEKNAPLTPEHLSRGSQEKVWWRCTEGHIWRTAVLTRTINGSGCPYCAGRFLTNDRTLSEKFPDLAAEWHPTKNRGEGPENVAGHSNKKAWWQCKQGHEWESTISNRARGSGCPYCSGNIVALKDSLASQRPDLMQYWDWESNTQIDPQALSVGSGQRVHWKCEAGHKWIETPHDISRKKREACSTCIKLQKSITARFPELTNQWHASKNGSLVPHQVSYGSKKPVWWRCTQGHEWLTSPNSRTHSGRATGCPACASEGGSLSKTHPDLAIQWDTVRNGSLTPKDLSRGHKEKVWWMCDLGHSWEATVAARACRRGTGCPICARAKRAETRKRNSKRN